MKFVVSGAVVALMAAAGVPAVAKAPEAAPLAVQVAAVAASPDVHPFRIGALEAWSLKDGEIVLPVASAEAPWRDTAAVTAALTAAGQPTDAVHLSIQPLLVRDGTRLVLIDTGAGGAMGTQNKLLESLKAAGVDPAAVTDVLISHAHGDHLGGLAKADGTLNFPNAVIRMSAPEWAAAQAGAEEAGTAALVAAISPKVQAFEPGAQVSPSIKAVPLAGHTAGHSGYEIVSGPDRLLYIGDALHSSAISVARPELANAWDIDGAAAVATRRSLLNNGAEGNLRYYAGHFPYPGVGRIRKAGDGYVWVPET